jgi:tetratricopeptide (TPR) repeat protein
MRVGVVALGLGVAGAGPAPIGVQSIDGPHDSRLVFELGNRAAPTVIHTGDTVEVVLGAPVRLPAGGLKNHNLRTYGRERNAITLHLVPHAEIRQSVVDHRLVLEVLDPETAHPAPPAQPQPAGARLALPSRSTPAVAAEPDPPPPPAAAPVESATLAQPAAMASAARIEAMPGDAPGHALVLPFAPMVGAAAFQLGQMAVLVFDSRVPLDLKAAGADPVFLSAKLQLLPDATMITFCLPAHTQLRLTRTPAAWTVVAIGGSATPQELRPIAPSLIAGGLKLPATSPGRVISVPDPRTGDMLLVGTQLTVGEAMPAARRTPDFALLPTWQGILVEPAADDVTLRAASDGFTIGAEGPGRSLALSPPDQTQERAAEASRMSRRFDLPSLPDGALMRRMQGRMVAAAAAPPQSRLQPRLRVAESMLALGMGAEAAAVLDLAAAEDARAADDPQYGALAAVAAVLAGRDSDADGLDDPRLDGTDEIRLWRAVREAHRHPGSAAAALVFANTMPLLLSYPATLRARLLPVAAETMARGGQVAAAHRLLDRHKDDPTLDLARAMASEADGGDPGPALAQYDALTRSRDRKVSAEAAERGAELRLAKGLATPAQTAAALTKQLLAWRDDATEVDRRLRIAELLDQAGQFRASVGLLREAVQLWPAQKDRLKTHMRASFIRALAPEAQAAMSAFDMVTLVEDNGDLLPEGEAGQALAEQLSKRLTELDLPQQAAPLLERLATSAPPGLARATFGSRLAAARLQLNDPAGAVTALARTTMDTLPPGLLEQRTLTFAAAMAAQHDLPSADNALRDLDTEAADETMAQLHETAKDWPNAVQAWSHAIGRSVTGDGPLTDTQATLLVRLASAATEAGDESTLAQARVQFLARMPAGKLADTFNLLTDQPVQSQADLPMVSRDMGLVAAVPGALAAMTPASARSSATP